VASMEIVRQLTQLSTLLLQHLVEKKHIKKLFSSLKLLAIKK